MTILKINGVEHEIKPGIRPLVDVLRDDLYLIGTKEGCGIGLCGACTVLIDGKPISSCLVLAEQVIGKEIVTIEGLVEDGKLHPVQQVFIDQAGFQCAYCTPGFVLSAVSLLEEKPNPTQEEILEYFGGNLCRCGSYINILKSVMAAIEIRIDENTHK